jgi:cytochrome c-type biogenesis protein CcmH/NrfF
MRRSHRVALVVGGLVALGLVAPLDTPLHAQSSGTVQARYGPNAVVNPHIHEGEMGELWLAIERNLRCNCSCGLDVHSCQYQMQCDVSPVWSARIRQSLEAGQSREAIEASFVADFGRTVLMTPPPEGFNLVGYFLPAVAIITAGMLIGLVVRRGSTYRRGPAPVTELDDEDEERLRTALRRLDETEGPDW